MTWVASERYAMAMAPDGLSFVQDFLNTRPNSGGHPPPDLLATVGSAQRWLDAALGEYATESGVRGRRVRLTSSDLAPVRSLRAELVELVSHRAGDVAPAGARAWSRIPLTADLSTAGEIELSAAGSGWAAVAGVVAVEVFRAQTRDTFRRLKSCRNDVCPCAFYDRSRNNSGVWHDSDACGNIANLRASRARRRATPAV